MSSRCFARLCQNAIICVHMQSGASVLYAAAHGGLSDLAKELIDAGLDINHKKKVRAQ